jgi:2-amino-4-hydroxy-6-hydroxymethyldihydropteridine diphosphokinase
VDILLYGERQVDEREPWLTIPHPEMWRRLFVLLPLRDLRPELRGPDGRPIDAWIRALAAEQPVRPASVAWRVDT